MRDVLLYWDYKIFGWINQVATSAFLDPFFTTMTDLHRFLVFKALVFPALFGWGLWTYRRRFLKWILALAIVVGVTDAFNYRVLKSISQRSRPAFDPAVEAIVRLEKSPSDPSFPSNHAANNFAGAVVLSAVMPHLRIILYTIAFLVAYSRPYVGVHFPLDVFVGAIVGICIARILIVHIFRRFQWWEFPPKPKIQ